MEKLPENTHLRIVLVTFYVLLGVALAFVGFKYLLPWLLPFICAYIFASLLEPIMRFFTGKLKMPRLLATFLVLLLSISVLGFLLFLLINRGIYEIQALAVTLPAFIQQLPQYFMEFTTQVEVWLEQLSLPIEVTDYLSDFLLGLITSFSTSLNISAGTFSAIKNISALIPSFFLFMIAFLVSSFFMLSERQKIHQFLLAQLSPKWRERIVNVKGQMILTFANYLRAVLTLISITFVELLIGLSIVGVDFVLTMAIIIALVDALPVFGTGTVLIPWAIFTLLTGNTYQGIALLVLYVVILVVRNTLEPKIVGQSIGLHPLFTLLAIYVGFKVMGVPGMFIFLFLLILIKYLNQVGYISLFKMPPAADFNSKSKAKIKK